jgi:hypothetical protein
MKIGYSFSKTVPVALGSNGKAILGQRKKKSWTILIEIANS